MVCKSLKTIVVTWLHEVPYIYIGIGICNLYLYWSSGAG